MRKSLNTSTALLASLSLFAGGPAFPQESVPAEPPMVCADGSDQPCPEGVPLVPAPAPEVAPLPETTTPEAEPAPETPVPEPAPAPDEPVSAAPVPEEAAPEAAPAEPAPESQIAPEVAPVPGEATPEAAPEPAPDTAVTPDEATPAETVPESVPKEPAPAESAPAEPAPVEPAPAEAALEPAPRTAPEPTPAPEAAPDQPAVTEPAPQPGAAAAGEEGTVAPPPVAPAPEATAPDVPAAPAPEAETPATEPPAAAVPVLPDPPDAATGEAPATAAAAAGESAAPPAGAEVTEETVTEDTARSSDEDFANPVNQPATAAETATAAPAATATPKKDRGLSDGEKAILLGIGALAVGAMLTNNRKVELNSGDRVVLERPDGSYQILKDDNALLRQPGSTVRTERFNDGSTRTTVLRADGSQIVTIRDAEYRVLRRVHVAPGGQQTLLFDDTVDYQPVDVTRLPQPAPVIEVDPQADEEALRAALARRADLDRQFSLAQIRDIAQVRALVPVIDLTTITFETGSAAIRPDQAESLARIGRLMKDEIDANPREVFLIEGHTDAVGSAAANLALSDRRAETVALALSEYFEVPPENMVVQGYGEEFLKVPTAGPERQNRRASVRRITDLLRQAAN